MLSGSLTGEQARQQLQPDRASLYSCGIAWGNGLYTIGGHGPMTEAEALEYTGLESLKDLVLITFSKGGNAPETQKQSN